MYWTLLENYLTLLVIRNCISRELCFPRYTCVYSADGPSWSAGLGLLGLHLGDVVPCKA